MIILILKNKVLNKSLLIFDIFIFDKNYLTKIINFSI